MAFAYPRDAEGTVWVRSPTSPFYNLRAEGLTVHGNMYGTEIDAVVREWADRADLRDGSEVLVQVTRSGSLYRYRVKRGGVVVERA